MPVELYRAEQVRQLDQMAIEDHGIAAIKLMRRAAAACVAVINQCYPDIKRVSVCCGAGNNAADGYIIAGMLAEQQCSVDVIVVGDVEKLSADGQIAYQYAVDSSANLVSMAAQRFSDSDLIIDALIGTGLNKNVTQNFAEVIAAMNDCPSDKIAVDIPSGLCADTGNILGTAVVATHTISFIGLKQGLMTMYGPDCCGKLHFDRLSIPITVTLSASSHRLDYEMLAKSLKPRAKNTHKNSFGHLLVIGGDQGMGGAIAMTALAAMRSGAGVVSVATRTSHSHLILASQPEIMVHGVETSEVLHTMLDKASAVAIGPGLGQSDWSHEMFTALISWLEANPKVPVVVDADALSILAIQPQLKSNWILTPHPGEASRLLGKNPQQDRFESVKQLQQQYGGIALLKGAGTVIASEDKLSLNPYGNPGMATAGMGDVLTGVISGLVAQGFDLMTATEFGAVVHSLAADHCVLQNGERGLMATDLLPRIRALLNPLSAFPLKAKS